MEVVNYVQSWKKAAVFIQDYNKGLIVGFTQSLKPRYDLRRKLRTEHMNLLRLMIRLYSVQLRQSDMQLMIQPGELPTFKTNSPALAKVLDCSPRTIRNLLTRLISAEVITGKQTHGTKRNYELKFSPNVLSLCRGMFPKADLERIDGELKQSAKHEIEEDLRKRLPLFVASKTTKENNLDSLENKAHAMPLHIDLPGNPAKQNPEKPLDAIPGNRKSSRAKETVKQEEAGRSPENTGKPASILDLDSSANHLPNTLAQVIDWQRFEGYYIRLLSLIQAVLYPRLDYLAESQIRQIHRYLALEFGKTGPEDYQKTYLELRTRILIVEGYLKRKPGRYVPIPSRYFDTENPNGFEKTALWYEKMGQSAQKRKQYAKRYQTIMRTWDGFLQIMSHHVDQPGWNKYAEGKERVRREYPGFLELYDYVILSGQSSGPNPSNQSS